MKGPLKRLLVTLCLAALASCLVTAVALADSYQYVTAWGSNGTGNGQFNGIKAIAMDASGNLYVADYGNARIEKLSSSGAYLTQWATPSITIEGLAVDPAGNVYAIDYWNALVLKYSPSGSLLSQFSTSLPGETSSVHSEPVALAVDSKGDIWVADTGSTDYPIKEFSPGGSYLGTLGTKGTAAGQFWSPAGIAIDSSDNIYVVDSYNYDVQKFSSSGTYLSGHSTIAPGDANLLCPLRLALDSAGNMYVADAFSGTLAYDSSVKKFNASFVFQTRIGAHSASGVVPGTFDAVAGLVVDASGAVYIADGSYDRILKFTETAAPTPTPTTKPSVSLRAVPKSVKAGHSVTISGQVKNLVAGDKAVAICRKIGGKVTKLKGLTISGTGAFRWTKKMTKPGKWVLVATYKVGSATYASKAVTVTVHK